MRSSVTSTLRTRGSLLGCAAVLTPRLQNAVFVLQDNAPYCRELTGAEPVVGSQRHWVEPELAGCLISPRVDVHWLVTVEAVEEQPVRARNSLDCRHESATLPR